LGEEADVPFIDTLRSVVLPIVIAFCVVCGLLAVLAPRVFAALARSSSRWVESRNYLEFLDRRVDIDRFMLSRSRLFGALLLLAIAWCAWRLYA
jgi:hypothetical protein